MAILDKKGAFNKSQELLANLGISKYPFNITEYSQSYDGAGYPIIVMPIYNLVG